MNACKSDACSQGEEWRPIPGFEDLYSVSNLGRVFRNERTVSHPLGGVSVLPGKLRATPPNSHGYPQLTLYRTGGGGLCACVARLVALAFIGPRPVGMHLCHNDGDRQNSALVNLRYDTPAGNQADRKRHGTYSSGEAIGTAKLKDAEAALIRADRRPGHVIAAEYGVSKSLVNQIRRGATRKETPHASM